MQVTIVSCASGFPHGEQLVAKINTLHQFEIYNIVNFGSTLKRTDKIRKIIGVSMNKKKLVQTIAKNANVTIADAEKCLGAFISNIEKALARGDKVTLVVSK